MFLLSHPQHTCQISTGIRLWQVPKMCTVSEEAWSNRERTTAGLKLSGFAVSELFCFLSGNYDRLPTHTLQTLYMCLKHEPMGRLQLERAHLCGWQRQSAVMQPGFVDFHAELPKTVSFTNYLKNTKDFCHRNPLGFRAPAMKSIMFVLNSSMRL